MHTEHRRGITVLDAQFMKPEFAASYLIMEGDQAAFIDTGTAYSVPEFMCELERKGMKPEQVRYVILTHIHLDHAGGAGALMQACPEATLIVHPRGYRHMVNPEKLIQGTYAVFGEENAKRLYGEILGISEHRVRATECPMDLDLGGRTLHLFDAPGHAKHHIGIWDEMSRSIFTGDCFGLSYRFFDTERGAFTFPTTTPVHFDPDAMHATVELCLSFKPEWICPTHFGAIGDVPAQAERMHRLIDGFVELVNRMGPKEDRHKKLILAMGELLFKELQDHGVSKSYEACLPWLEKDLDLNAQGLLFWWDTRNR